MYLVNEISKIAGVSVRTLHHYDQIDLLKPDKIDLNGYRKYSDDSLGTLLHILFLKELDFPLKEIKSILNSPNFNKEESLEKQKMIILKKRDRLNEIIKTLDYTINSKKEGIIMDKKRVFDSFNMNEIKNAEKQYAQEVKEKYGNSDSYKESIKRTSNYTENDWKEITLASNEIMNNLAKNMDKNPGDPQVQVLIKAWQDHISKYYYDCNKVILASLGESYVDDSRFSKNIDKFGTGLSIFFRDAIRIFCD